MQYSLLSEKVPREVEVGVEYQARHKTFNQHIQPEFFWPGLKSDVTRFSHSCHVCQLSGKPNQTVPATPPQLISVIGELKKIPKNYITIKKKHSC